MGNPVSSLNVVRASASHSIGTTYTSGFKIESCDKLIFFCDITAKSGTLPTLNINVETTPEHEASGATYYVLSEKFVEMNAVGNYYKVIVRTDGLAKHVRLKFTVGGSATPTVTFQARMLKIIRTRGGAAIE